MRFIRIMFHVSQILGPPRVCDNGPCILSGLYLMSVKYVSLLGDKFHAFHQGLYN
jgi:hypothetical protein